MAVKYPSCNDPIEIDAAQWDGLEGELAFDVGANCGQSISRLLGRYQRVVAFEPAIESFEVLVRAHPASDRLTLVPVAVSATDGAVELLAIPHELEMGQLVTSVRYDYSDNFQTRELACRSLDSLADEFGTPDLVKIDTEGHELKILRGAARLLRERQPSWLIEFHNQSMYAGCVSLLQKNGYEVDTIRHPHYPQGSFLWFEHGWLRARGHG